eukprot:9352485-Pyramimonas_sp.AAC.1
MHACPTRSAIRIVLDGMGLMASREVTRGLPMSARERPQLRVEGPFVHLYNSARKIRRYSRTLQLVLQGT